MSITAIISGIFGATSGLIQNIIEKKQELRFQELKYNQLLQLEEIRLQKSQMEYATQKEKNFDSFTKAVIQTTKPLQNKYKSERIANFITAMMRPFITLVLLLITAHITLFTQEGEYRFFIIESSFATLDYIIAFWFVRRSFEKKHR